jgi:DNA (cytosine-5)-methyltransferase 1
MIKHASLFSGIGGFDLAAQWMGWENVFHCEWNEFGQRTLKYYWPNAISYGDITKTDFTIHRGSIDVLSGGFPCQPFSVTGKRKGVEDNRHLWPEMLRAIREIQPKWVVGENVPGIINWGRGLVFEQVCIDLENEGYEVQPIVLPAVSVDAQHRRDRVWFIANTNRNGEMVQGFNRNSSHIKWDIKAEVQEWKNEFVGINTTTKDDAHSNNERSQRKFERFSEQQASEVEKPTETLASYEFKPKFKDILPEPKTISRNDGISIELSGITFSKWREESTKAYGNAIVPQIAYELFKVIDKLSTS